MTEPMEALFLYAQENMLCALLAREPKYADALRHADSREKRLRTLLDEQGLCDLYREQAQFCAGFRLALELARG